MTTTILTLFKQGYSQRSISRITGHYRVTINKIIKRFQSQNIEVPIPIKKAGKLDKYHS